MIRFGLTGSVLLACGLLMGTTSGRSAAAQVKTLGVRAGVPAMSCVAAGECAAGGFYGRKRVNEAYVISETNGSWGDPVEVRGTGTLDTRGRNRTVAISCVAVGVCAAAGIDDAETFVVSETNGRWGKARTVAHGVVRSISCGAAGSCAVGGGAYFDYRQKEHAFLVTETTGRWGKAFAVPGLRKLDTGGDARVSSVSCAAAGECSAGGWYTDSHKTGHAFVVSETNGHWGKAIEVPGTEAVGGGGSEVTSISCSAVGECAAAGDYPVSASTVVGFVISETSGSWGPAIDVQGLTKAYVNSISCAAPGECAAGGAADLGAFVVSETNGTWGNAIHGPGTASGAAAVNSVSCAAPGECAAGGYYTDDNPAYGSQHAFVVDEANGSWGNGVEVAGLPGPHYYLPLVTSVSCGAVGDCAAGGEYGNYYAVKAFLVNETNRSWGTAIHLFANSCVVPNVVGKPIGTAEHLLGAANCGVGKVARAYSTAKPGRVIGQRRRGTLLKAGAMVALTVSRGEKP